MSGPPSAKRAKQAESQTIQLFRSYSYDKIPDIAFYGTSKDEIKPYIKDKMQQEGTYSPSYYEFKLNKDDYKLLDLSSVEGQDLLKGLFTVNGNVMSKAFRLEKDKYIRKSDNKEEDVAAFTLIKGKLDKEYVGTITNKSSGLSHSEVVIFNQEIIGQLNTNAELKTDIVVTPKVIRKSQKRHHLRNMPKHRELFNNSSEAESEDEGMSQPLTLSFSPLMNNKQDKHPDSPVKKETRESMASKLSGVAKTLTFGGGKRRSVKKSKNQKKTKRNNSTKKRRRTKKKKSSKN